jgi:hypothetical protein
MRPFEAIPAPLARLFQTPTPPALGPERRPDALGLTELDTQLKEALGVSTAPGASHALIRGALLLWHDHLEESHAISQSVDSAEGSFLHAMMHRREPDAANSKYWWRRVGAHPCFERLAVRVGALLEARGRRDLAARLAPGGRWDPFAVVDTCEQARHRGAKEELAVLQEVQRIEFETLLEHLLARP